MTQVAQFKKTLTTLSEGHWANTQSKQTFWQAIPSEIAAQIIHFQGGAGPRVPEHQLEAYLQARNYLQETRIAISLRC
ncbi:hypothetical protein SD10_08100 [Spirosoma radiotolerans]|uniref:Uncharacterized protein n=1 Tax=Spirosoma radiotolerans TaxID=1379870 RepID=A0A0E3V6A8_9BACT|nr:hypothetical protein SD10_08100 [Spirosoma radiotolerans]